MFLQSFSHFRFGSIWENLISASDDCAHASRKPKRFSLAAHVHATMAGTTLEQKARFWHL
ncbi:hypothetical protein SAMN05444159_0030 [Bradyrhizobium lablabi]|uniref:Uncharacterized protein n=1 Tax=Bradyrhizobium lablabi TaxID=722472 RepID=A0A1M6HKB3_9BRAD|nr:hypothetical protein SAMN05444159_0030 [Bradyrhizobium lablabi]